MFALRFHLQLNSEKHLRHPIIGKPRSVWVKPI